MREIKSKTVLTIMMFLPLLSVLIGCAGTNKIVLHPIEKSDIFRMEKGTAYTPEKNGYFLSDEYVAEVAQAKIEQ